MKFNDENLKKQADLKESYSVTKKKDAKKSDSVVSDKNKKRPRDALQEKVPILAWSTWCDSLLQEEEFVKKPEVKILIPDSLKVMLVDDWENITKDNKVRLINFKQFYLIS